jgi:hypothetical protein
VPTSSVGPLGGWATLADLFAGHRSPAYARLAQACAADPQVEALGPPLVVLHVVRLAALQGRAQDPWTGDPDAFRRDAHTLHDEVAAAVRRGIVQFTEPLRMADLLPGLLIAAARYPDRPLRLIDIGACAGLHLNPECYEIRYPRSAWSPTTAGMTLECALDVPARLLERELAIADRVGIDLAPVDPAAPGTFAYLRSFSWAGDPDREQRLQSALITVASRAPEVRAGSVMDLLPDLLAERVSPDAVTAIIDSATSRYLSGRDGFRLGRLLDRMACRGPLALVSRGRAVPNQEGLPTSVGVIDLSRRWCITYAASDLLSERMLWVGSISERFAGRDAGRHP